VIIPAFLLPIKTPSTPTVFNPLWMAQSSRHLVNQQLVRPEFLRQRNCLGLAGVE
jgi:hypothetical protein